MSSANTHFLLVCVSILISVLYAPQATAQPFEGCRVSGESATIVIPSDVNVQFGMNGQRSLDTDDLIAAYTDNDQCAGVSNPWDGSQTTLPVFSEDQLPGYTNGESITLRIYDASEDEQFEFASAKGELTFTDCSELPEIGELCRDNGAYAVLSVYQVESLIDSEDVPLPVELAVFKAYAEGPTVILRWVTASETNNAGFWVEQRTVEKNWTDVAFVHGAGTTADVTRYRHTLSLIEPGQYQFRLRQVDLDGTAALSTVQSVLVQPSGVFSLSPIRPHPVSDVGQWTLTLQRAQPILAEVYNTIGQRVATLLDRRVTANQSTSLIIDTQRLNLPSGRYFLRVQGSRFSETRPVTILR